MKKSEPSRFSPLTVLGMLTDTVDRSTVAVMPTASVLTTVGHSSSSVETPSQRRTVTVADSSSRPVNFTPRFMTISSAPSKGRKSPVPKESVWLFAVLVSSMWSVSVVGADVGVDEGTCEGAGLG